MPKNINFYNPKLKPNTPVMQRDIVNGDVKGGGAQIFKLRLFAQCVADISVGEPHCIIKPRAHEVELIRAVQIFTFKSAREFHALFFKRLNQRAVPAFLIAALQAAKADLVDIFHPFKIGDGHPARIGKHIRNNLDAAVAQDFIGLGSDGAVGGLNDEFGLNGMGIINIDDGF